MTNWRSGVAGPVLAAVLMTLVGCSFGDTPEGVAAELIEGDLATQLGLGEITATCETPPNRDAGTTFTCTSPTEFGEIQWLATMADESTVNVESTNLVAPGDMVVLEQAAVDALEVQYQTELGTENFDCGDQPVVLADDLTMVCALTDPADPSLVYDTTLTFTDITNGTFDINVAEEPRS